MKNILIVEDNLNQLALLNIALQELGETYKVINATSIAQAKEAALATRIDLFIFDIGLPDGSGLDLANDIRKMPQYELTWIVFLTTYVDYILKSFKQVHCYDYILKPYNLDTILAIAKKLASSPPTLTDTTNTNTDTNSTKSSPKFLSFPMRGYILKVNVQDIVFIEVNNKTCILHSSNQQHTIKRTSLTKLLELLPADVFVQCHRSYAVNVHWVQEIRKNGHVREIIFKDYEEKALLGDSFKDNLLDAIK